jgi:hypothetical protein
MVLDSRTLSSKLPQYGQRIKIPFFESVFISSVVLTSYNTRYDNTREILQILKNFLKLFFLTNYRLCTYTRKEVTQVKNYKK